MGSFDRIRLSAICRLISREVPRRAIWNPVMLIRRMDDGIIDQDYGPRWVETTIL
jgi:hypothetical protein